MFVHSVYMVKRTVTSAFIGVFRDLTSLVIVEKIVFVRAEETQMSAILLSRGPICL